MSLVIPVYMAASRMYTSMISFARRTYSALSVSAKQIKAITTKITLFTFCVRLIPFVDSFGILVV